MPTKRKLLASTKPVTPVRGVTSPAPKAAPKLTTTKPAGKASTLPFGTAAAVQASRSNVAAKPAPTTGKPAATPTTPAPVAAGPSLRGLARDATGIIRAATNFEASSDRDAAYLRFYGSVCRKHGGSATLTQLREAGTVRDGKSYNPHYAGSAKATDIGAINRAIKAGLFTRNASGDTITATKLATTHAAYNAG